MIFTCVYLINIILNFVIEREVELDGSLTVLTTLDRIAIHYLKSKFAFDFITVFPLYQACSPSIEWRQLCFLIKSLRIQRSFRLLSSEVVIQQMRQFSLTRIKNMIS